MAKHPAQSEKTNTHIKEKCKKCQSYEFSISNDVYQTRYCSKCKFVWTPMTPTDLKLMAANDEIERLKSRLSEYEKASELFK